MQQSFQIRMKFNEEGEELEELIAKFLMNNLYQTDKEEKSAKISSSNLH
ncbi:MAG: hypothetical protein HFJ28_02080 [Clostridia bacterium]|nr:hypothetical protein [Clostridia bacterium]